MSGMRKESSGMWKTYIFRDVATKEPRLSDNPDCAIGYVEVVGSDSNKATVKVVGRWFRLTKSLKREICQWLYEHRLINPETGTQVVWLRWWWRK